MLKEEKKQKSFSLKKENARKVEKIAFDKERTESAVVDEMIEVFNDAD